MVVIVDRSPELPMRRVSDTVPPVVGFQDRANGLPAVTWYPLDGLLKGLAVLCA